MSKINNIKKICQAKGIRLYELANETGLNLTTISHYSRDIIDLRKADFVSVLKIASVLECEPKDLFQKPYSECIKNWKYDKKKWGL